MLNFPSEDRDFEETVRFLSELIPDANKLIKPTLLHSLRVGGISFSNNYNRDISNN